MATRTIAVFLFIAWVAAPITACTDSSYDGRLDQLSRSLREKPIGSTDHWIEKYSTMSAEWQRTALVFGYGDDYEACLELISGLLEKYPDNRYRCTPAN